MPPKVKIKKEDIILTAYEIARKECRKHNINVRRAF